MDEEPFETRAVGLGRRMERGNFAIRPISAGARISTFDGALFSRREIVARIESGLARSGADPLELGLDLYMQVDEPYLFFNHACEPNAGLSRRCDLVALRDIAAGEAITCDYATNCSVRNSYVMPFDCACGAPSCRRRIGNLATVPLARLRRYLELGALQDYIRGEAVELLRGAEPPAP